MSFSPLQIMERAERQAMTVGVDAHSSPVVDSARIAAEDLFPQALRAAITKQARNPQSLGSLKRTYPIVVAGGVGVLPDAVIDDYLCASSAANDDPNTGADLNSFCVRFADFQNPSIKFLGYYAVSGTSFLYRSPNAGAIDYSGTVYLTAVGVPVYANLAATLDISSETAEMTIEMLAAMIRGQAGGA